MNWTAGSVRRMQMPAAVMAIMLLACSPPPPVPPAAASPVCAPGDQAAAVKAIVGMYAALKIDSLDGFHAVTTPDFYAFERGVRLNGDELAQMVFGLHTQGKRIDWSVTQPTVHLDCKLAIVTYTNVGAIGTATAMQPVSWLESAELVYTAGAWRVRFFHSTRT